MLTNCNPVNSAAARSYRPATPSSSSVVEERRSSPSNPESWEQAERAATPRLQGPQGEVVVLDDRAADYIVTELENVRTQCERELARQDLYPNVRDRLFKRKRALEDTVRMFAGRRPKTGRGGDANWARSSTQRGRIVFRPIRERDNVYKELPPGILRRVVRGAGGKENVRWPEEIAPQADEAVGSGSMELALGNGAPADTAVEGRLRTLLAEHLGFAPHRLAVALSTYVDGLVDEAFIAGQRTKGRKKIA